MPHPLPACWSSLLIASFIASCANPKSVSVPAPPSTAEPAALEPRKATARANDPDKGSDRPAAATTAATAVKPATTVSEPQQANAFPPADFAAPFARTAQPGDGHWLPFTSRQRSDGETGSTAKATSNPETGALVTAAQESETAEKPLFYQTTVHPDAVSRFHSLSVVAIDLGRVRLGFVPGAEDKGIEKLKPKHEFGIVPARDRDNVVAVFNGGFQAQHGWWGYKAFERILIPPKDIACTLALFTDGSLKLGPWATLKHEETQMFAFRQTPPCLVDQGELHPYLLAHNDRLWSGKNPNEKTRRRSAVGLDQTGRILFYAVGTEVDAAGLARGMKFVGAVQAAQLDINWNWTRFLLYARKEPGADLKVERTLLEGMPHNKRSYVSRAEGRDFFYLVPSTSPTTKEAPIP